MYVVLRIHKYTCILLCALRVLTWVHGGASGEYSVGVQVLTDINVALHDGVVYGFVDTARFHTQEGRLEECFWATESLVTDGDDLSVGKFVALLE